MRGIKLELEGKIFGRLKVISYVGQHKTNKHSLWLSQCICESLIIAVGTELLRGNLNSCGCLQQESFKENAVPARLKQQTTHGNSIRGYKTSEYITWTGLKQRTTNPLNPKWKDYGGRGIKVCDRWLHSFENFLKDVGPKPESTYSLDRINNDGNYEPGNVKWATKKEQVHNRRKKVFESELKAAWLEGFQLGVLVK